MGAAAIDAGAFAVVAACVVMAQHELRLRQAAGHFEFAAQGITRFCRFECDQSAVTLATALRLTTRHRRKTQGGHTLQAVGLGALHDVRGCGLVAHHHHITAQELTGVAL